MKILLAIVTFLAIAAVIYLYAIAYASKSTSGPGLASGLLSQCSSKPNCVCSEYKKDTAHYIEPIGYSEDQAADILQTIKAAILLMEGDIIIEINTYIAAIFTSNIFGFIDDFEIRIDKKNNLIHIRSASRVGRSDLGANKKRVDEFKNKLSLHLK